MCAKIQECNTLQTIDIGGAWEETKNYMQKKSLKYSNLYFIIKKMIFLFPLQNWQLPHMVKNVNDSRTQKMLTFVKNIK